MSLKSPIQQSDNWFAGEDKVLRYFVTTGPAISVTALAQSGATSISVSPLTVALAAATKVRFGGGTGSVVATLTAPAAVGALTLAVAALTGAVQVNETGKQTVDVSLWAVEWALGAESDTATPILTKTVGAGITLGADGQVDVALAAGDTAAFSPATYWYSLRRTDAGNVTILAFGPALLQLAGAH